MVGLNPNDIPRMLFELQNAEALRFEETLRRVSLRRGLPPVAGGTNAPEIPLRVIAARAPRPNVVDLFAGLTTTNNADRIAGKDQRAELAPRGAVTAGVGTSFGSDPRWPAGWDYVRRLRFLVRFFG